MNAQYAVIGRKPPTPEQERVCGLRGIELVYAGDRAMENFDPEEFREFKGVVVDHPGLALRAVFGGIPRIAVFQGADIKTWEGIVK